MNYHHSYHAGNFADVIKHITLVGLVTALKKKEKSFCYLDTHAGQGYYDLFSAEASKNKEYNNGIEKIIRRENPPDLVSQYLECIHHINNQLMHSHASSLRYYPGSAKIVRYFARPHDRIIACELQAPEYQTLKADFQGDKQTSIHHLDGYLGLKAFLPPKERRGFVLIDPPYENPDEFSHLLKTLPSVLKYWDTGTYALWYPIKAEKSLERFFRQLKVQLQQPIFNLELTIYPPLPTHLNGSGMIIINPPWQFPETMSAILPWLWDTLSINKQGSYSTNWL